jgi:CheY-like chemotaxis protein
MQIPDKPVREGGSPATFLSSSAVLEGRPPIMIQAGNIALNPHKRQKNSPVSWSFGSSTKRRDVECPARSDVSSRNVRSLSKWTGPSSPRQASVETSLPELIPELSRPAPVAERLSAGASVNMERFPTPCQRQSRIRDILPTVIHEALRVGERPDSSIGQPTMLGEKLEVRSRSSSGHASCQIIDWSVQANVPEVLSIDERDLSKLVSCVFLNATKFTENGTISVMVSLSSSLRSMRINIIDNGAGIPDAFLPELFKPFSREDDSLTRSKEGLGLGLLVAKGLARKLGGDLNLLHTQTSGQMKGSEFEIKIPITGSESRQRAGTPVDRTPTPLGNSPRLPRSNSCHTVTSDPNPSLIPPSRPPYGPKNTICQSTPSSEPDDPTASAMPRLSPSSSKILISGRSSFDRELAKRHPLTFLVAEDNKINRRVLVSMLAKLGYRDVYEAFDGHEAVQIMKEITGFGSDRPRARSRSEASRVAKAVDIILMDLWMPEMDGYEATERIFDIFSSRSEHGGRSVPAGRPAVLAISADVTEEAISRATAVGMQGFMTKPCKLIDLQKLIEEVCTRSEPERAYQ